MTDPKPDESDPSGLNGSQRRWTRLGPMRTRFLSDVVVLVLELASMMTGTLSMLKTFSRPRRPRSQKAVNRGVYWWLGAVVSDGWDAASA